jgi:hypothetical protein
MTRFGFTIKTRAGALIDDLQIGGHDRADAERRIGQIYPHSKIVECAEMGAKARAQLDEENFDLESAINLIDREGERASPQKSPQKS